jgi:hypothetical protein
MTWMVDTSAMMMMVGCSIGGSRPRLNRIRPSSVGLIADADGGALVIADVIQAFTSCRPCMLLARTLSEHCAHRFWRRFASERL